MPIPSHYAKFTFQGYSAYLVAPGMPDVTHNLVTIRHGACLSPWTDQDVHYHQDSEEYYFLLQGELYLLVAGSRVTLKAGEALLVKKGVPHAVTGGVGPLEHFVIRAPALEDRQSCGAVPSMALEEDPPERELQLGWGYRAPLTEARCQNCWLFGVGQARFYSDHLCLAYLNFPTEAVAAASGQRHGHRLHLHQNSWEYYTVLRGAKVLQVENELVEIRAGEILAVAPQARHTLHAVRVPFEGFTFRVPLLNDKVEL